MFSSTYSTLLAITFYMTTPLFARACVMAFISKIRVLLIDFFSKGWAIYSKKCNYWKNGTNNFYIFFLAFVKDCHHLVYVLYIAIFKNLSLFSICGVHDRYLLLVFFTIKILKQKCLRTVNKMGKVCTR